MTLTPAEIGWLIGAGSSIGSMLFWGVLLMGRLMTRVERAEASIIDLDKRMDRAGDKMSDLANHVQALPDRFMTRSEAMTWRGSRAEDKA